MSTLNIRLFGAMEIRYDGELLTDFRSQKALALLAYLICIDRPVTREHLAGLAWPDMEQGQALGLLRRTLHDLTSKLPACLVIDRRTVHFQPAVAVVIDVRTFAGLAAQDDATAWAQAVDLYRAPFLEGVYLDNAPELESWLLREQEAWQQQVVHLLDRLISHHMTLVAYGEALRYARRLVALEPWREEAHCQVMLLLARTGQLSAALTQYRTCRQVLWAELAVEPAQPTQALYTQLQRLTRQPLHKLPLATTRFIGREEEVNQLVRLLATPHCRLITLLGVGGIGKSRLALETARTVVSDRMRMFWHGACFVALAGIDTAAQLVLAVAQALGLTLQGREASAEQIFSHLCDKELLLLLDNFEQLIEPQTLAFLSDVLTRAPAVKLMITTRTRLNLHGEQLYWVQGLHVPLVQATSGLPALTVVNSYSSVQLFVEATRRLHPFYTVATADALAVATICQLVQGMPLAIELAAAWMEQLTQATIAVEISRNLDFLSSEMHNLPVRQRSMRAVFATAWQHLVEAEQDALMKLAVFRSHFDQQAAFHVAEVTPELLQYFANHSFVTRQAGDRYEMHELLRQLAAERLAQSPALATKVTQAYLTYYSVLLTPAPADLKGEQLIPALQLIKVEYDHIRAAWLLWSEQQAVAALAAALPMLYLFYDTQSWYRAGIDAFQFTLDKLHVLLSLPSTTASPSLPRFAAIALVTQLTNRLARFYFYIGNFARTEELLTQALALAQQYELPSEMAFALARRGHLALSKGEMAKAVDYHEQSLALYQQLGDTAEVARQCNYLGVVAHNRGRLTTAWHFYQKGYTVAKQENNPILLSVLLHNLGKVSQELGRYTDALHYLQESLRYQQLLDDQEGVGYVLNATAHVFLNRGEYSAAHESAQQALTIFQNIGYQHGLVFVLRMLGEIAEGAGQPALAFQYLHESLTLAREMALQLDEALALTLLARLHLTKQELTQALQLAQLALHVSRELHAEAAEGYVHVLLGEIMHALGDETTAYTHLQQALAIGRQIETPPLQLEALFALAWLLRTDQPVHALCLATIVAEHTATVATIKKRAATLLQELSGRVPTTAAQPAYAHGKRLSLDLDWDVASLLPNKCAGQ